MTICPNGIFVSSHFEWTCQLTGSLSNDNGDGKKAMCIDWKNNNFASGSCIFLHFLAIICCTTMTWTLLISRFVEDGNTTQQLCFSFPELSYSPLEFNSRTIRQHLTNCTRWNKRNKVWGSPNSLFKWCFHSCRQCCCLNSLKTDQKKIHFYTITFQEDKHLFFCFMFLLVRLVHSIYYWAIFNILTRQKEDMTKLKFLRLVNMTGNSSKFILTSEDVTCIFI